MIEKENNNLLTESKKFWCHLCQSPFISPLQPGLDQIFCPKCQNNFCQIITQKSKPSSFQPYQKPIKPRRTRIPRMTTQAVLLALAQYAQDANVQKYREINEEDVRKLRILVENQNNLEECLICKEQFVGGIEALRCPCNHVFHVQCLSQWMEYKNTCPKCRVKILRSD